MPRFLPRSWYKFCTGNIVLSWMIGLNGRLNHTRGKLLNNFNCLLELQSELKKICYTVEPWFNEPLFNEVLDITNDILRPDQSYSKMYGIEPRYNEPWNNKFFDITNINWKPKRKIYLDITNYNVNTRQKINIEQINSQQIL